MSVVHGRGFELWLCGGQWWLSACRGFESFTFGGHGGVVHGRGFESLTFGSMVVGSNLWLFGSLAYFQVNTNEVKNCQCTLHQTYYKWYLKWYYTIINIKLPNDNTYFKYNQPPQRVLQSRRSEMPFQANPDTIHTITGSESNLVSQ
jgi:hypothetical protein